MENVATPVGDWRLLKLSDTVALSLITDAVASALTLLEWRVVVDRDTTDDTDARVEADSDPEPDGERLARGESDADTEPEDDPLGDCEKRVRVAVAVSDPLGDTVLSAVPVSLDDAVPVAESEVVLEGVGVCDGVRDGVCVSVRDGVGVGVGDGVGVSVVVGVSDVVCALH